MNREQYLNRKEYVEQARSSFEPRGENGRRNSRERGYRSEYDPYSEEADAVPKSFFKLRLFLAVLLFLGFLVLRQTDWSYHDINAASIQKKIETSITLPESLSDLLDVVSVIE